MPLLSKLVGNGVGLAKEYSAYRKASKPARDQVQQVADDDQRPQHVFREPMKLGGSEDDHDTRIGLSTDKHTCAVREDEDTDGKGIPELAEPPPYEPRARLPLPVILPQQRPGNESRGFVRAYAPVLNDCGVDRGLWFDFLNGFHDALKMTPLFHVAEAAVAISSMPFPSFAVQAGSMALGVALDASSKQFMKYQTNKYLDSMNDKLFKPRRLYATIMSFEPDSFNVGEGANDKPNAVKAVGGRISGLQSERFRASDGSTHGEFELPQAAPLIFVDVNGLPEHQRTNRMNKTGFVGDYMDRRAQAKFEAKNPGSRLAGPSPIFASSWSDPNASANRPKSLIEMIGGSHGRDRSRGPSPQPQDTREPGRGERSRGAKKFIEQHVLYLMVVNLPGEEEIAETAAMLDGMDLK